MLDHRFEEKELDIKPILLGQDFLSEEQARFFAGRLVHKGLSLEDICRSDIVALFDYDLTMASKDNPKDVDDAPLKEKHFGILCDVGAQIKHIIVQTARGDIAVLDYLRQKDFVRKFGFIPKLLLASNSGHKYRTDISDPKSEIKDIPIPGYENTYPPFGVVLGGIKSIMADLKNEFPHVKVDERELCGALTFNEFKTEEEVKAFFARANQLRDQLGAKVAGKVYFLLITKQ